MPDIIDNNKVGNLIKKLLKEHNMTQDDLARELCISKSAVSQNINGKSTFDIQNLVTISKLFDISLEQLITQKSDTTSKEIISEYERIVKKGVSAFKSIDVENMLIDTPDIYGNVLIEYVIKYEDIEVFKLLHNAKVNLVDPNYHKVKIIYTKIIWFCLKNKLDEVIFYIDNYVRLFGSLVFSDEGYKETIWLLINDELYKGLVDKLYDSKVLKKEKLVFKLDISRKLSYLQKKDWIDTIAKYKLNNVLEVIIGKLTFSSDYETVVKSFVKHEYYDGLIWYIDNLPTVISNQELRVANAQSMIYEITRINQISCFDIALKKGLYTNIDNLIIKLINDDKYDFYMLCIDKYQNIINYRSISESIVKRGNLELLKYIVNHLNQNDLNFLLSITDEKNENMILYLLEIGAKFEIKYYNSTTISKINNAISILFRRKK